MHLQDRLPESNKCMYRSYLKRVLDIIISIVALPILLIIIMPVALMIKLEDSGPVFYCDIRLGKNGKAFRMFKFRTMKVNSPDIRNEDGSTFNSANDPRLTNIGKILRRSSIDEIPQFINVLLGHMSIVGPRPNLADSPISEFDEIRLKRITVRPGITGFSQAYYRNSIVQLEKFKNDCYYIDNISFLFDVKIILKTVSSVLYRDNINGNQLV